MCSYVTLQLIWLDAPPDEGLGLFRTMLLQQVKMVLATICLLSACRFRSRINLSCIDQRDGRVDPAKFPMLGNWRPEYTLENLLTELRREMGSSSNRKLPQPPEGTMF